MKGATLGDLLGRRAERDAVDTLLSKARAGRSGALVVRGTAGIGKTALLQYARDAAATAGFRIESSVGVESEMQFAFAGLHQLCAPLLDHIDTLPPPQRTALGVAFGQQDGATPDRFLVGLATLNLLAEAAEVEPLLCLVDDAQWLDEASAQVLAFVARRVAAERIAFAFAVRDVLPEETGRRPSALDGLPELRLHGLDDADARALLESALPVPLDERMLERIVAESWGNPLALLELPQSAAWTGGFESPSTLDVPRRLEESFRHRFRSLPDDTRVLLLAAAAEPTGDAALLFRAASHLDVSEGALGPAEAVGLVSVDGRVTFRHPLVRSAIYRDATPPDQRRAHDALAAATDPDADPDRRAWHRAQAVLGLNEEAAAELEQSAGRALRRGGLAAAGAFLQRATELTPDPADRSRRALDAAEAKQETGASGAARELLAVAEAGPLDALQRGRLELLRAQISFHLTRGADVPGMLLDAAETLAPLDGALSRNIYLHALDAAIITGGPTGIRIAEAMLSRFASDVPTRPVDLLLHGLAVTMTRGYAEGVPTLRCALAVLRDSARDAIRDNTVRPWLWIAGRVAVGILDDELAHVLAECDVAMARADGALARLPASLNFHANVLVISGQLTRAGELAAEAAAIADATGGVQMRHAQAILAGWRGDQAETDALNDLTFHDPSYPADGTEVALAQYATAVLHNGLGEYALAREAAAKACDSIELSLSTVALPELIEASVRTGEPERAAVALEELSARARASDTSWARGLEARSRALTVTGPGAEDHYREATARLDDSRVRGEAARAHLLYGEWLRREGRRQDAREQLRTAHELLTDMGAVAFAARAARELRATGERPQKRTAQPTDALTSQELHIARLVATGATSREVGTQLFLSPRTIEAHLRNIFRKLGISSRRQLKELPLG
nr:LuxR family transcriptional regulator [Microbacterium caowuchunii]